MSQENSLGPGARLQQARTNRKFEIDQIADKLRLSPKQVESIERDDFSYAPITFVKGHLRLYARLVDLSANEVIKSFDALGIKENLKPTLQKFRTKPKEENLSYFLLKWSWVLGLILIALLVTWWFTHRHAVQENVTPITIPAVSTGKDTDASGNTDTVPLAIPNNNLTPLQNPSAPANSAAQSSPIPPVTTKPLNQGPAPQHVDQSVE